MSKLWEAFSRLPEKIFRCTGDDCLEYPITECYACTQVGVPVFHSTTCDPVHKPEWENSAGSSLVPIIDPRSKNLQSWNRGIVLARGISLAVDPLYFFAVSVGGGGGRACIYLHGGAAAAVSVLRSCVDVVHVCHLLVRFRLAYVSRESLVVGCGKLVWDARAIAAHYMFSLDGFWFDIFVILPIPQAMYCVIVPLLLKENRTREMIDFLQMTFLIQFLPKVYHCFCLMRGMRKVTGYIFGTVWWGFGLSLIAYFLASHAYGGYWYILAVRRIASCLIQQCDTRLHVDVCHPHGDHCGNNSTMMARGAMCLDSDGPFRYGIFEFALPLMSSNSFVTKTLYSNLWGLMALSTMANNLEPTSDLLEVLFSISIVLAGLLLFTMLIGNIQVFLHAVMLRRRKMQLRYRDMEWWMKRRQLPSRLRRRVRKYEHQIWETMGGQDEMELIKDLPEGLRRDIKHHICLDLIKKVPLFHNLDDLILDNICDRVKPLVYSKNEKIMKEGDPVQRIVFILEGQVKRNQGLRKGRVGTSMLESGSFVGDELISWCIRRPFLGRLPISSATFTCTHPVEAFALEADDLRIITDHFRYHFGNESLRRTARYYSSNWRTWAAVNIQLAWRRYVMRTRQGPMDFSGDRLRNYAAIFLSLRPHDHLE
ncbi:hypothetical protein ACS0TY_005941 [Phlomoides rotata]